MDRSGLFWKVLLPSSALVLATGLVMSVERLSGMERSAILVLLVLGAVGHAVWITGRVRRVADALTAAIRELGTGQTGDRWNRVGSVEVAPLIAAVEDLERRLLERVAEVNSVSSAHSETNALLETVLTTMVEGVVVLNDNQRVLFANEASRPLLDLQARDLVARPIWEVSRLSVIHRVIEQVAESSTVVQAEFEVPRTRLTVAVTVTPLPLEPRPGVMLVLRDVTELRRLESMRRDFVANVSHELKTPLTSIQAYADSLLEAEAEGDVDDPVEDVDQRQHFLREIVAQSERLGALILDIIHLGKIESNPEVFDIRDVAVAPVVVSCLQAHAAVALSAGVELIAEPIASDLTVRADVGELRTIFDNLVDNALRFTPAGGRVTVGTTTTTTTSGGGADGREDRLLGLSVTDTGVGIPKDQQTRIFERFYRVDRARDRQRGGTGLGLSIVKHLCQLFGGRVEVSSQLGKGTRFVVWLPRGDRDGDEPQDRPMRGAVSVKFGDAGQTG